MIHQYTKVAPAAYVTIALAATITGLSEKAIRRKIEDGKWIEGREYRRSPDGGIFISMKGYEAWIEKSGGSVRSRSMAGSRTGIQLNSVDTQMSGCY
jgi:hypothetical protein